MKRPQFSTLQHQKRPTPRRSATPRTRSARPSFELPARLWVGTLIGVALLTGCRGDGLDLAGTVERRILELGAPVSEIVVDIPVAVGDRVAAGQVLVRLDTTVAEAELRAWTQGADALADSLPPSALRSKQAYREMKPADLDALIAFLRSLRR